MFSDCWVLTEVWNWLSQHSSPAGFILLPSSRLGFPELTRTRYCAQFIGSFAQTEQPQTVGSGHGLLQSKRGKKKSFPSLIIVSCYKIMGLLKILTKFYYTKKCINLYWSKNFLSCELCQNRKYARWRHEVVFFPGRTGHPPAKWNFVLFSES